jgi:hypothetical protein
LRGLGVEDGPLRAGGRVGEGVGEAVDARGPIAVADDCQGFPGWGGAGLGSGERRAGGEGRCRTVEAAVLGLSVVVLMVYGGLMVFVVRGIHR